MPARSATNVATPRLTRTSGPATVYVAPTSKKIAAPTIAPSAAIVTSNRPRSRVTRTRTEPASFPRLATEPEKCAAYLSLWRSTRTYASDFDAARARSEEHTSELQSQFHLVCRLLL